jgi:ABC-type transporter MlaC component
VKKLFWVVVLVNLCLRVNPALAQSPTEYVRGILDRVMAIQSNASFLDRQTRSQEIHQIIISSFDFNKMSRDVLGSSYSQLSSGQRNKFLNTFVISSRIPIPGWFSIS